MGGMRNPVLPLEYSCWVESCHHWSKRLQCSRVGSSLCTIKADWNLVYSTPACARHVSHLEELYRINSLAGGHSVVCCQTRRRRCEGGGWRSGATTDVVLPPRAFTLHVELVIANCVRWRGVGHRLLFDADKRSTSQVWALRVAWYHTHHIKCFVGMVQTEIWDQREHRHQYVMAYSAIAFPNQQHLGSKSAASLRAVHVEYQNEVGNERCVQEGTFSLELRAGVGTNFRHQTICDNRGQSTDLNTVSGLLNKIQYKLLPPTIRWYLVFSNIVNYPPRQPLKSRRQATGPPLVMFSSLDSTCAWREFCCVDVWGWNWCLILSWSFSTDDVCQWRKSQIPSRTQAIVMERTTRLI